MVSAMKKKVIDEYLYKKTGINNLIIFSISRIEGRNEKCTFEGLVEECFCLFPKVFCLSDYSKWPDSRKLDRPLRTLRKKSLITGDPKNFFSLTKAGKKISAEIEGAFCQRRLSI